MDRLEGKAAWYLFSFKAVSVGGIAVIVPYFSLALVVLCFNFGLLARRTADKS